MRPDGIGRSSRVMRELDLGAFSASATIGVESSIYVIPIVMHVPSIATEEVAGDIAIRLVETGHPARRHSLVRGDRRGFLPPILLGQLRPSRHGPLAVNSLTPD